MELGAVNIVSVGIYNTDVAVRGGTLTRKRKTAMFEIEIPIEAGGASYVDGEECPIGTDILICAKPGQMRHTRLPFKCYYVHFILKGGALYDALMRTPTFLKTDSYSEYLGIFREMCRYFDRGGAEDVIMLQSLLLKLIYSLALEERRSYFHRRESENRKGRMLEDVLEYIGNNLTSELTLEHVAAYAGFSPIHFHKIFKTSLGKTLHCYIEEERLKRASSLLVSTGYTLTEIAYECGFSSQSYFSFAFKRKMGVTPREYVKIHYEMYGVEK